MRRHTSAHRVFIAFVVSLLCILSAAPTWAQSTNNPSGLALPRFASTRSAPVNVRVGPGTRYDLAWTYLKAGQPVEIIQEFDTWRKIRDSDGDTGWVHQNLLSGRRVGLVTPWGGEQTGLRLKASDQSQVRAWLSPSYLVAINSCENAWCAVEVQEAGKGGKTYSGFVPQTRLWGVYPNEEFD